jgi:argininosuccinate lyase
LNDLHSKYDCYGFQGSKAYVKAIEKVGIVTSEERDSILQGLEKVRGGGRG